MRRREIFAQAEDIAHYASLREAWATVPLDRKGKNAEDKQPEIA